ncbi:hypothetical protein WN55_11185 [Dufourea novaeangliae]|uniref:Uncharacterized protein n=1 Tax=Dufourea novaeangliae TaxID=178035 RepID=A0A154PC75_DUFNO|nr:hypothetical protein WN55_11185 [Dufourea novaeangliae]
MTRDRDVFDVTGLASITARRVAQYRRKGDIRILLFYRSKISVYEGENTVNHESVGPEEL